MRWMELFEYGMSDYADIINDINDLTTADLDFDIATNRLFLSFEINGSKGSLRLRLRSEASTEETSRKFRSKLYAAAIAVLGGRKPASWQNALNVVRGTIRSQAIKILTNPEVWSVESLKYDGFDL